MALIEKWPTGVNEIDSMTMSAATAVAPHRRAQARSILLFLHL
jgi:hypothetical protein